MKKTVKFICDLIGREREHMSSLREKEAEALVSSTPKGVLLTCPYPLRFFSGLEDIYIISSYGGVLGGNEASLDHAVNTLSVPVVLFMGHEDCSALKKAIKGEGSTVPEQQLFQNILPAFAQGKARKYRDNVMKHLDHQISLALDRYRFRVKEDKLVVAGLYCDAKGKISLTNYNGLRGVESLSQALPDVDPDNFLE
ncbi:MAG: carbonic anhydrase [Bacillota bacterium]|nr:carbonic anhydrase [Bacillota bacterium]